MRKREQEIGTRNLIGKKVETLRRKAGMRQKELLAQLQVRGISIVGAFQVGGATANRERLRIGCTGRCF